MRSTARFLALLLFVGGCGRIGFDARSASGEEPDARANTPSCWANAFCLRREITIDSTHVHGSDQVNFPVLISGVYSDLATRANGGTLESTLAQDILFTSDPEGSAVLSHELESYDAATGAIHAWVSVPLLSAATDTTFYMFYSNPGVTNPSGAAGTWDSSFQGVWHFAESAWTGAAGEVIDSTGKNHGTVQFDSALEPAGKFSQGALFDTDDDHIDAGNDLSLRPASITVELWSKPQSIDSAPNRHPFMLTQDTYDAAVPLGYYMEVYRTQTDHRPTFYTGNGTEIAHAFGTTLLQNDLWYHFVGTHDAATGTTTIYVNGQPEGVRTMSAVGLAYNTGPLKIGGTGRESWNGMLDEVRISDSSRSADWIRTSYDSQSSPATFYAISAGSSP